jgi:hypothetical protein
MSSSAMPRKKKQKTHCDSTPFVAPGLQSKHVHSPWRVNLRRREPDGELSDVSRLDGQAVGGVARDARGGGETKD